MEYVSEWWSCDLKVEFLQSLRSRSQLNYFTGIGRYLLELNLSPEVLKQERKGRFLSYPGKPIYIFCHYSFLFLYVSIFKHYGCQVGQIWVSVPNKI